MKQIIDLALDAERLSALLGRDVVADRLRPKADTSLVVGLRTPDGDVDGWVRWLWPDSQVKALKVAERAERRGQRVQSLSGDDGLLVQSGELAADPLLAAPYRAALSEDIIGEDDHVLRYNPLRRLVVKRDDATVRVFTHPDPVALPLDWTLAETGLPVPGRIDDGSRPKVAVQRFVGDTDLATTRNLDATRAAGRAFAHLHSVRLPGALVDAIAGREPDVAAQGRTHARLIAPLDAALAERIASVAARVAGTWYAVGSGHGHLIHGDASPDQVLLDTASGRIWITDFERACMADPVIDLGSYLANASEEEGVALLLGYDEAGGEVPSTSMLTAAKARAALLALVDPLRRASVTWQDDIASRLDVIEGWLR